MAERRFDMQRLAQSMRTSRQQLERFRTVRREIVREYAGKYWSEEGVDHEVIVNLVALYVQVMGRSLVAKTPRFYLSTFDKQHKPAIAALQAIGNKYCERIGLDYVLRAAAIDSLFSIGITQVSLATPAAAAAANFRFEAGQPYAANVDLDDWGFDPHARCFEDAAFEFHRMRVPLAAVREDKMFGPKRKKLEPSDDAQFNPETGDERISMLGRIYRGSQEEVEDMIDLWQVWVPRERCIHFFASQCGMVPDDGDEPLLSQDWIGPYCGPYHHWGMFPVPGNAMPKAPLQDLIALHLKHNNAMRKLADDVANMKELTVVGGGNAEDGLKINQALNGETICVRNLQGIQQFTTRGQNLQQLVGMATFFKDVFDFMGGNLALVGGRSQQASTATQEKILNENASAGISDMQETAVTCASKVISSVLWYLYQHPERAYSYEHSAGPKLPSIVRTLYPRGAQDEQGNARRLRRDLDFNAIDFRLDPYSMRHSTPEARLNFIMATVKGLVAPLLPMFQQQGVQLDLQKLVQKISELGDQPDLSDIITIMEPMMPQGGGQPSAGQQSGDRTYNRVNPSEQTQEGQSKARVTQLLSGKDQGGSPSKNGQAMVG